MKIVYNEEKFEEIKMKKAFTLAETVITLVIIGFIAVLTFSNLMKVKPDENATLFKKTFYTIQDAVRYLSNDTNKYPNEEDVFKCKSTDADCARVLKGKSYQQYFCEQVAEALNTVGKIDCGTYEKSDNNGIISGNNYEFQLTNGAILNGFNQPFANEDSDDSTKDSITICVDVNGLKTGPNKGCAFADKDVKKRDQFKFRIHFDGKVSTGDESEAGIDWAVENAILEETGINTK